MINIILGACEDDNDENTTQYTDDDPNLSLWHFINLFFECVQFIYRAFERSVWTNHSYDASIFLLLSVFFFSIGGEEKNTTINRRRERHNTIECECDLKQQLRSAFDDADSLEKWGTNCCFFPQFGLHLVLMLRWNNPNKFANGKIQWKWSRGGTTWSYFIAMLPLNKWHFRFYSNSFRKTHNSTRISLYNNDERHYVWSSDLNLNVIRPKSTECAKKFSLEAISSQRFELCEFDWRSVML